MISALSFQPRPDRRVSEPLPVERLWTVLSETSLIYAFGKVDASGRISARSLLAQLGWRDDDHVVARTATPFLVLQRVIAYESGSRSRLHVVLPAAIRAQLRMTAGECALLVGSPQHDVVVVVPRTVLDRMVVEYLDRAGR
ncbi:hypothetical protein AB0878_46390 [Amycolatopsis sp. NPDC047767]|uniref:hypothetical protein n=1 Tax=Amycolatopsis sp. NPDC047767 TaxID=3156765 RepID=UPI00345656ED